MLARDTRRRADAPTRARIARARVERRRTMSSSERAYRRASSGTLLRVAPVFSEEEARGALLGAVVERARERAEVDSYDETRRAVTYAFASTLACARACERVRASASLSERGNGGGARVQQSARGFSSGVRSVVRGAPGMNRDIVRSLCQSCEGLAADITDQALDGLAQEVDYRAREVIQEALKFATNCSGPNCAA